MEKKEGNIRMERENVMEMYEKKGEFPKRMNREQKKRGCESCLTQSELYYKNKYGEICK